ncbi:HD domain-containing phosphohydrolase [Romboutsia sp. 1001216sp1]|uniref:HD domain-containing phosphohydrolase n=1 Tax=Romboutsia sp. 1001216sp1 TaxID=2986997 RepID=UPI00232A8A98|nr:HD domain-containing phosphohydrolase [Romboutsia sp. 1001216sp1]MDB8804856.1 response regulator [Romboutsia sp. 1001216sp1]MDB8808171.1 response regulator [Romboutsia sp. 1001216sp1]MDB8810502.1 response regulator [Romboutsia sp. 1001216sp1]MDB8816221.1 response regulator [Romboutsia sp. 1001216sp1]MDB8818825.1 response regulator [Romboutsia sp. 1001216sp1]
MKNKHILIVDNSVTNLKRAEQILKPHCKVSLLTSGVQTLRFLTKNKPDLIFLDINMTDMDVYETLEKIKSNKDLVDIPVIFLTSQVDIESELKGIEKGAIDFIRKPFVPQIMISRIKMHLELYDYRIDLEKKVIEKTEMIEHLQDVMMISIAELVECRDENTGGHVKRTAKYVEILTKALVERNIYSDILSKDYVKDMIRSAPLHDVGKIGINDKTLLKNGYLDEKEFEFMKTHSKLGGETIQRMINQTDGESFLYIAKDMAQSHHEKWNGTGYPDGLKEEEIPLSARVMAIADVYDALTTKRPYKEAFTHDKAVEIILDGKGIAFDPVITEVFEEINSEFELARQIL